MHIDKIMNVVYRSKRCSLHEGIVQLITIKNINKGGGGREGLV